MRRYKRRRRDASVTAKSSFHEIIYIICARQRSDFEATGAASRLRGRRRHADEISLSSGLFLGMATIVDKAPGYVASQ